MTSVSTEPAHLAGDAGTRLCAPSGAWCNGEKSRRSGPVSRILFPPQGLPCERCVHPVTAQEQWHAAFGRWSAQRTLRRAAAIHLGPPLPAGSGALPGADSEPGRLSPPIWACWRWGLPCHGRHRPRGALLPHHFTLTVAACAALRRYLSVALSVGSRPPGVTWHRALWSPDFPPCACAHSDCLADSWAAPYQVCLSSKARL